MVAADPVTPPGVTAQGTAAVAAAAVAQTGKSYTASESPVLLAFATAAARGHPDVTSPHVSATPWMSTLSSSADAPPAQVRRHRARDIVAGAAGVGDVDVGDSGNCNHHCRCGAGAAAAGGGSWSGVQEPATGQTHTCLDAANFAVVMPEKRGGDAIAIAGVEVGGEIHSDLPASGVRPAEEVPSAVVRDIWVAPEPGTVVRTGPVAVAVHAAAGHSAQTPRVTCGVDHPLANLHVDGIEDHRPRSWEPPLHGF